MKWSSLPISANMIPVSDEAVIFLLALNKGRSGRLSVSEAAHRVGTWAHCDLTAVALEIVIQLYSGSDSCPKDCTDSLLDSDTDIGEGGGVGDRG